MGGINDSLEMSEMLRLQYEKAFSTPATKGIVDDPEDFFSDEMEEDSFEPKLTMLYHNPQVFSLVYRKARSLVLYLH